MKKYMKSIASWFCMLLMVVSMVVPVMAARYTAEEYKDMCPTKVTGITAINNSNNTIIIGDASVGLNYEINLKNIKPTYKDGAWIYGVYFIIENSDGEQIALNSYNSKKFSFKEENAVYSVTMNGGRICYADTGETMSDTSNVKEGIYTLKTIKSIIFGDQEYKDKEVYDASNSGITINIKNSSSNTTTSSKPTEDQIGGKYQSADVTTNAGGESTATVAMTDISSQVGANLNDDAKAFAKELYNIVVKSSYIPANSKVEAGKVLSGSVYTKVASIMSGVDGFRAFEINLLNVTSNAKVQPTSNGSVYVTVDLPTGYNKNTVVVYRINDNDSTPVKLNVIARTDSNITFETNHFSTFVIAKNAIPESNGSNDDYDDNDNEDTTVAPSQNNNNATTSASTTSPSNGTAATTNTTATAPKTGDMAPIAALLFVMICGGAICAVSVKKMIAR